MMETERVADEANDGVQEENDLTDEQDPQSEDIEKDSSQEGVVRDADEDKEDNSIENDQVVEENNTEITENEADTEKKGESKVDDDVTEVKRETLDENNIETDKIMPPNDSNNVNEDEPKEEKLTDAEKQDSVQLETHDSTERSIEGDSLKEEKDKEVNHSESKTPSPPPRPNSPILSNKDKPLDWQHFTLHQEGEEDMTCFLRCRDEELTSSSLNCTIGNISGDAIEDSEEVISNCVTLSRQGCDDKYELLSYPVVIAIPYQISPRLANTRELVVKQRVVKEEETSEDNAEVVKRVEWKILQPLTTDSSIADHKGQFVEVLITRLSSYAVVARMITDKMTISKKGGVIKSTADHRISVTYPQGACTLLNITLQIQSAETVAADLKTRFRHCSELIGASPILHMIHTPSKKFDKPITVCIPCPPNPNKSNTPGGKVTKTEKKEIQPMLPEGAIVIRKTKKSTYGGDAAEDFLHALYKQTENSAWNDLDKVEIKQIRKDVVSLDLKRPIKSLMVLRMGVETKYTPKQIATTFEQALQVKYANIILYHKFERPEQIIVQIVPSRQFESTLRRLNNDDYENPPDSSPDIPMTEGQEITISFTGNIEIVGHKKLKITFHTQRTNLIEFTIREVNKFGNHSSSDYRGVAEFSGRSRVVIDQPEDPEEILLRESEAKTFEKQSKSSDFGGAKSQKEQKVKEKLETNAFRTPPDLLYKLAVSIPKSEPDPLMPPSRHRFTALDVEGTASNENLLWLSKELGSEWVTLATYLGIKKNRIQNIKGKYPMKMEEQVFHMLITWRSEKTRAYNKERKLNDALVKCGRYDLSEELKERKTDSVNSGSRDEEEE